MWGGKYPVDIAVFLNNKKNQDEVNIIVECKRKNRKDGKTQLEDYLRFCRAEIGVWFNGEERLFLRKYENNGKILFQEINNIPKYGQTIDDIGRNKIQNLIIPHNLKTIFKVIHNYLAGNSKGVTRSETISKNLINIIFCKIYDEKATKIDDYLKFSALALEPAESVKIRIEELFQHAKNKYKDVFDDEDIIGIDANSLKYVVGELQNYYFTKSERDVIADAFETFVGYTLKGESGQFFTARNVVKLMVDICNPKVGQKIIDPACGTGGFLLEGLKHFWASLDKQAEEYGWSEENLFEEKKECAISNIKGIEKDEFLAKVAKAYMAIMGDGKGGLFCEDSLDNPKDWGKAKENIILESFDFVLTNPPFGKKIFVTGKEKLAQFELANKDKENPQVLFIERSMQLLKDGGELGIILPETYFFAPTTMRIREYLKKHNIKWVIDLPHNTFRPYCNAKCLILIIQKNRPQQEFISMAVAEEMGHNHNGKEIFRWDETKTHITNDIWDDIKLINEEVINKRFGKYTFQIEASKVFKNDILVPRYYWSNKQKEVEEIAHKNKIKLVLFKKLIEEGVISVFDGHGSPPSEYKGTGDVPYIRVKDIVNWEIYKDPTSLIPEDIANSMRDEKRILLEGDIAYVKRGSYRIGSTAMVSNRDDNVILTKEILIFRIIQTENKYNLDEYYLMYLLNHPLVQMQTRNKVFIETTLPNIGNRYREIYLPFFEDVEKIESIRSKCKLLINSKWNANKELASLQANFNFKE